MASPTFSLLTNKLTALEFSQQVFQYASTNKIPHYEAVIEVSKLHEFDIESFEIINVIVQTLLIPSLIDEIEKDGVLLHVVKPTDCVRMKEEWF